MTVTGYGTDLSCRAKLHTAKMVSGRELMVDAIVRALTTPTGALAGGDEESIYGTDLAAYVGTMSPASLMAVLPSVIESELLRDQRISTAEATATQSTSSDGIEILVRLTVTLADETDSFDLTLAISDVTVDVIGGIS